MSLDVDNGRILTGDKLSLEDVQRNIEGLLNSQIERSKFLHDKAVKQTPSIISGMHLDGFLEGVQKAVHHRIAKLSAAPTVALSQTINSWSDENIRLQVFYGFLRNQPTTLSAFKLCEALRQKADHDVHAILSDRSASPKDIQSRQQEVINKARESIGKVVFAADVVPRKLIAGVDVNKLDATMLFVDEIVSTQMNGILKQLDQENTNANNYSLQDANMLMYIQKPKAVANVLLTSQGQLNLGLVSTIKNHFFPSGTTLLEYERGIIFVLDRLDVSWQKSIDAIQVPIDANSPSNAMIRADLGLIPSDPVTKLHCQLEALGGLFSQLCQGPVGDCFAVSWAIKKHDQFLESTFKDYSDLIRNGYLTRSVNGKPEQFFFEQTIAEVSRFAEITVYSNGAVKEYGSSPFWECPNLIAAARQMGMEDLEGNRVGILHALNMQRSTTRATTWDDLIRACATVAAGTNQSADQLLILGRYGFSLANNRLLRAWETTLAGMAEARPGDYVRDNINQCVMTVFQGVFASQEKKATAYQRSLIEGAKKVFQQTLNDSFRLVYNGDIPLAQLSSDGSSSSGGFELYQRDIKDLTAKGIRIATPEQFRAFVFNAVEQAASIEKAKIPSQKDRLVVASVFQALHLCAAGNDFLKTALYAYDQENKKVKDPVANYQSLQRTPMTSLDGDNPWEVMAIDTGKDFTPDIRTIRPKDPGDLLKWLLGLASWKETTEHYLSDDIPNEETEGTSPTHAFNIEIEGQEFKDFLGSKLTADAWIKKTIIDPGMVIAKSEMDKGAKLMYQKKVKEWLSGQLNSTMPDHLVQALDNLFGQLNSRVMTVQQFAQRAQDGMTGMFKLNEGQIRAFSVALDGILIQSLPSSQAKVLHQESVRFAKTNWDSGPKNIFFCCFFNPRTGLVDFGSIYEDKTHLQPMDQFEWVDDQQWEVNPTRVA